MKLCFVKNCVTRDTDCGKARGAFVRSRIAERQM